MISPAIILAMAPTIEFSGPSTVARMVSSSYARCLVEKQPDLARRAVLEDWAARQMYDQKLHLPACLHGALALAVNAMSLKAGMAAALIDRDGVSADAAAVKAAAPFRYRPPEPPATVDRRGRPLSRNKLEEAQAGYQRALEWQSIEKFGECVVRHEPSAVLPLVRSVMNSAAETAAFKPFGPHLGNCLPKGATMELDKPTLRAALTLAYYRLANAPHVTEAAK